MEVDRISELKGDVTVELEEPKDVTSKQRAEINEHMKLYDPIKNSLNVIKTNVGRIEKLRDRDRKTANEKDRKEIMKEVDKMMDETNAYAAKIKKQLDEIKLDNEKYAKDHKESAKYQMRTNLYSTHIRRFHQIMNEYNTATQEFKQALQDRTRRQLKIVDKNITEESVEKILESGNAQDVIKEALISEDLEDAVRDIEDRHQDILRLEKQVQEVFELFRDLAALVDLQQESLDVIETRVTSAKNYTEKAETELKEAEVYQTSARKRQCCILIIVIVILCVILGPILGTQLGKS